MPSHRGHFDVHQHQARTEGSNGIEGSDNVPDANHDIYLSTPLQECAYDLDEGGPRWSAARFISASVVDILAAPSRHCYIDECKGPFLCKRAVKNSGIQGNGLPSHSHRTLVGLFLDKQIPDASRGYSTVHLFPYSLGERLYYGAVWASSCQWA